jgi:hypothetical protein
MDGGVKVVSEKCRSPLLSITDGEVRLVIGDGSAVK